MQLLLSLDERKMVTRALEKCLVQAQGNDVARNRANRLLDRILEHELHLSADELEDLSDLLAVCKREIKSRIAAEMDLRTRAILQEQQKILEHAADKIAEACMMA